MRGGTIISRTIIPTIWAVVGVGRLEAHTRKSGVFPWKTPMILSTKAVVCNMVVWFCDMFFAFNFYIFVFGFNHAWSTFVVFHFGAVRAKVICCFTHLLGLRCSTSSLLMIV